ncbi:MAG TPA: CaiB/BaiF CoA-transferase family protein [Acidimicrobiales bacterium]|nr:CaiB/BaiF CoA-transferase family protein [Acidimicrobiales bacterium]
MAGPLAGCRIIELAGIGPGPFAAMMLSDMGAEVLRVDRAEAVADDPTAPGAAPLWDVNARGRRSVGVDLKQPEGRDLVLRLVEQADGLIEGFRPGVAERLGLGPDDCLARRPALVYGRMTGWGQTGPLALAAGRDINYVALSGTLAMIGRQGEAPVPPLNLVGDFGGGGLLLAFGMVCALLEASRSGEGQVVDAAMVDGAALLAGMIYGLRADGQWGERGTNLLDSGAWFYEVYETADGKYVSVGPIDDRAGAELLRLVGLADDVDGRGPLPDQQDRASWPAMKERLAAVFRTRTRDEWCALLEGTDACFAPVLEPDEAPNHPQLRERGTFCDVGGVVQPAPAPRLSRTPPAVQGPPPAPGEHTDAALADWGLAPDELAALRAAGAIR